MARARRRRNVFDPRVVLTGRGHGQVRKRFQAGQVIYSQGDPPDAAFFRRKRLHQGVDRRPQRSGGRSCAARPGRFFRRPLPARHASHRDRNRPHRLQRCPRNHRRALPNGARSPGLCGNVRHVFGAALCRRPRAADQSSHAFRRATFGIHAAAAREFEPRRSRAADTDQSIAICQNDRHHTVACQLLHESLQAERLYRIRTRRQNQKSIRACAAR